MTFHSKILKIEILLASKLMEAIFVTNKYGIRVVVIYIYHNVDSRKIRLKELKDDIYIISRSSKTLNFERLCLISSKFRRNEVVDASLIGQLASVSPIALIIAL